MEFNYVRMVDLGQDILFTFSIDISIKKNLFIIFLKQHLNYLKLEFIRELKKIIVKIESFQ